MKNQNTPERDHGFEYHEFGSLNLSWLKKRRPRQGKKIDLPHIIVPSIGLALVFILIAISLINGISGVVRLNNIAEISEAVESAHGYEFAGYAEINNSMGDPDKDEGVTKWIWKDGRRTLLCDKPLTVEAARADQICTDISNLSMDVVQK